MADGSPVPSWIQRILSGSKLPAAGGQITIDWLPPTTTVLNPGPGGDLATGKVVTVTTAPFSDQTGPDTMNFGPGVRSPQTPQQRLRARTTVLRALGHVFDYKVLNNAQREQAKRIMHAGGQKWMGDTEPYNTFADMFAYVASGKTLKKGDWTSLGPNNTTITAKTLRTFSRFVHQAFNDYVRNGGKLPGDDTLET